MSSVLGENDARLRHWLLDAGERDPGGFYETEDEVAQHSHTQPWWRVMCLTGVDYFSTLGYQPGIAALAAGALAPLATLILVLVTLLGALPMYRRVAQESPHGDGSLSMLERLLNYWPSKLLVLALLGFVATGFVITITLSAADASAHLVENPFLRDSLGGQQVAVTLALIVALALVFLKGFKEAIGVAVVLVLSYLLLSAVVIVRGAVEVFSTPGSIDRWTDAIAASYPTPMAIVVAALVVFPRLALGLSGFETGVVVMPLIQGSPDDDPEMPMGRIRGARRLLTTAAVIMSGLLIGSSLVTTILISNAEFQPGGKANGRALAYLAHTLLGDGFGTAYDLSTIGILWFAGASAMAGLLNIIPRYLPRYGMAPDWARSTRPLVLVFLAIGIVVTLLFKANVDAQAGAYATGVLALMTSAAVAVFLTEWRRGHRPVAIFFGIVSAIFIYTLIVTILADPEGLFIAAIFIALIVAISVFSRVSRSTELRIKTVRFDTSSKAFLREAMTWPQPLRVIANKRNAGDEEEYREKSLEVAVDNHVPNQERAVFLEVEVLDPSEFSGRVEVTHQMVGQYNVLRAAGPSVPNVLAAVLLKIGQKMPAQPHAYFEWSEKGPAENVLRFLLSGEGDIPPLTHEILRKAVPDERKRPQIHVGG